MAAIATRLYTRRRMLRIALAALALICCAAAAAAGPAEIRVWHSMSGVRGAEFERLVARFNAEQKPHSPHYRVVAESGVAFQVESAIGGAEELTDAQGRLLALPIGRSTPVLYWNRDAFRVALLDPAKPPATWYEMVATLAALVQSGSDCALTIAWPASAMLENTAAWHNQAFATDRLVFNNRLAVRWVSTLAT